jgi:RecA-family ATPase
MRRSFLEATLPEFYDIIADGSPLFLTSIPNQRGSDLPIRWMYAKSAADVGQFVAKHDAPGMAIYFAVARLKDGAEARTIETVKETLWLWADVDFKHHPGMTPEEIDKRLEQMRNPPTVVINSGHGRHLYWRLHEPEDLSTEAARRKLTEALTLACQHVSGDPGVCEVARLMRVPGSHNTKNGDNLPVEVLTCNEHEYDLAELVDWWLEARPVMPAPAAVNGSGGNGHDPADPFAAFAGEYKAPIDVEARLAGMRYGGAGDTSIHATQLQCTGALLRQGIPLEDVVAQVLGATKRTAAGDARCAGWDWRAEEITIERMCVDLINKDHDLAPCLPTALWERFQEIVAAGNKPKVARNGAGLHVRSYGNGQDKAEAKPEEERAEDDGAFSLKWFKPIDPAKMPPRQFLYGRHYQRGTVSATVAPGGVGKTSIGMVEAVAMATARNLLGEQPKERCRVWLHNGEDPIAELERRVVAVCQRYNIPQEELDGWLCITSGTQLGLKVANGYSELKIDAPLIDKVTNTIAKLGFDVFIVDPLVTLHNVPENDNGKMDTVVRIFTRIASVCNCAIDIAHHTRKLIAGGSYDNVADDARGAAAVRDAVRSLRVLNIMSLAEAGKLMLDEFERLSYFRVDQGKANTSPPATKATWRKFENVELANGDHVGVVTAWEHPSAGGGMAEHERKADELFLVLLDRLWFQKRYVNDRGGPNFAPSVFAREPEARGMKVSKAALADAMRRLLDAGTLTVEEYSSRSDRVAHRIVRVVEG